MPEHPWGIAPRTCDAPLAVSPTRRRVVAQVIVCTGCCCGRVDRGHAEVPVERLKAQWKARRLQRQVQLTISGCLGPCDVSNVAAVSSAEGTLWLHHLGTLAHYDALLDWASACAADGRLHALPPLLAERVFARFVA
jgi:cobaltochelatase CobN